MRPNDHRPVLDEPGLPSITPVVVNAILLLLGFEFVSYQ